MNVSSAYSSWLPVSSVPLTIQSYPRYFDYMVIFLVTFISFNFYKATSKAQKKSYFVNQFPGPKTLPLIGNGHQMIFKETEFYEWSWNLCRNWGDPMRLWRLNFPIIFVSSYEMAMQLLSNTSFVAKSQDINLLWKQPGGRGLSTSPADVHNPRRKLLYPGYSRQVVERSVNIFSEESKNLAIKLRNNADSGVALEIIELLTPSMFRIMCRATFGDQLMSARSDEEALEQMHCVHNVMNSFAKRISSPYLWLRNDFIYYNLTSAGRLTWKCAQTISNFSEKAIAKRREQRALHKGDTADKSKEETSTPCYLDMLLDLCDKGDLKETDILGELNNFIVAGYDPTALTVGWTLFALALNPIHQDKIYDELKSIFGDTPTENLDITALDTKKMKYLELCVKESLRVFPTSPLLPRSTTTDIRLKDGRIIPADCDVVIMVDMIHMDPKHFPDPEKFRPERHLEPNPAFLPFSTGVRNCIGQVFAMHMIKVELAYLLREFIWETKERAETIPKIFQALMVPAEGIHFTIRKRSLEKS